MINSANHNIEQEADFRMTLSLEFMTFLRKAYQIFGDSESLMGRNLTSISFWFFIDTFYFNRTQNNEIQKIKMFQNSWRQHPQEFQEIQDLQFILKMRKLVSEQKMGTLNLEDIKSTPIDKVIQIAQLNLAQLQQENKNKVLAFKQTIKKEQIKLGQLFQKFNIEYRQCHPMFYYQKLQTLLKNKWIEQEIKLEDKQKCYLCSKPNRLITCNVQNCSLKVHPACYPTFTHRYDSKGSRPTQQQLKKFRCQNCVNSIDTINEKCEICCCIGGYFVRTNLLSPHVKITLTKQSAFDQNSKNININLKKSIEPVKKYRYVHLICFIWNTDLKWNIKLGIAEGFNNSLKKKMNGMCSFCGISFGCAIPCSNDTCRRFYHGQCAKRHKIQMNLIRAKTSVIQLFCQRHRRLSMHQSLQQTGINRFREVKKLFEGLDKEIKRLQVVSSYQQVKLTAQRDYCSICGKQQNWQKITVCKQCRKWYHNACSQSCKNCT